MTEQATINITDYKVIDNLIHLHTIGLIDDKAFIEAMKKVHKGKAKPIDNKQVSRPLQQSPVPLPSGDDMNWPLGNKYVNQFPFTVGDQIPSPWKITSSADKRSPLTATFTPEQFDVFDRPTDTLGHKKYGDGTFNLPGRVDVVPYSENRSHIPEHARQVLEWIDEAWDNTFREYRDTKKDWERTVTTDEHGQEKIEWKHLPSERVDSVLKAYKDFAESDDVVIEGDDADLGNIKHIFNLAVDGC